MLYLWLSIFLLTGIALVILLKPLLFPKEAKKGTECVTIQPAYKLAIIFLISIPLVACLTYLKLGNSRVVAKCFAVQQNSEVVRQEITKLGSRQNIILALRKKLVLLPANAESANGWYILGKLYFNENNLNEAIQSFQRAMELNPKDPEYMLQFVSTRFYKNQALSVEDKKIISTLLKLAPKNVNAINLLALDAYHRNDFAQAIYHWEMLLQYLPADSEDAKNLLAMIEQAQRRLPPQKSPLPLGNEGRK